VTKLGRKLRCVESTSVLHGANFVWFDIKITCACVVLFTDEIHWCIALPTFLAENTLLQCISLTKKCQICNNTIYDKIIRCCQTNAKLMPELSVAAKFEE